MYGSQLSPIVFIGEHRYTVQTALKFKKLSITYLTQYDDTCGFLIIISYILH